MFSWIVWQNFDCFLIKNHSLLFWWCPEGISRLISGLPAFSSELSRDWDYPLAIHTINHSKYNVSRGKSFRVFYSHSLGGPQNFSKVPVPMNCAEFLKAHKSTRQERCPTESRRFWLIWSPILTTIYLRQSRCSSLDSITIRSHVDISCYAKNTTVREFMDLLFYDE